MLPMSTAEAPIVWRACRTAGWLIRRGWGPSGRLFVAFAALFVGASLGFAEENTPTSSEPPPPPAYLSPQTVIDGGQLPEGWTPKLIPYSGVGPDGKSMTVMIAPTYVFTLPPAAPAVAPQVQPGPTAAAAAVAQSAAKPAPPVVAAPRQPPSVPYGSNWVYQTQGVAAATTSLAKSAPPAAPQVAAWGGSPLGLPAPPYGASPPPATLAAAPPAALAPQAPIQPPPQPQQYNAALQPPPTQWGSTVDSGAISTLAVAAPVAAAAALASPAPTTASPMTASIGPPPPAMQASVANNAAVSPATDPDPPLQSTPPPAPPASAGYRWRVVGVVDGDLMTCLDETGGQQKVRLAEIDAPELGQDYGTAAREALADYVFGKTVQVVDHGKDRSGRWIARVYVDGLDVNRELVAQGAAWHYEAASSDPSLTDLQNQARSRKLGLWAQPDPVPPWQWRAMQ
ncbi:MAG: thermonuclease family protein [Pirellulales bacterium]